jgi:hypothetical protein
MDSSAMQDKFHGDKMKCYAMMTKDLICYRVNTLASYCEANRQVEYVWMCMIENLLIFFHSDGKGTFRTGR